MLELVHPSYRLTPLGTFQIFLFLALMSHSKVPIFLSDSRSKKNFNLLKSFRKCNRETLFQIPMIYLLGGKIIIMSVTNGVQENAESCIYFKAFVHQNF